MGDVRGARKKGRGMRDYIGYLASVLVLCTFCARTMIPLRAIALASNVAFLTLGAIDFAIDPRIDGR
jgi:hypothetical protein